MRIPIVAASALTLSVCITSWVFAQDLRSADGERDLPQTFSSQSQAALTPTIALTPTGPADTAAFGDPERPFLLAQWLCIDTRANATSMSAALDTWLRRGPERRDCDKILTEVWNGKQSDGTVITVTHDGLEELALQVRNSQTGTECPGLGVSYVNRLTPRKLDLARIKCGESRRVDLVIARKGPDGLFTDLVSAMAVSFELPLGLPTASRVERPATRTGCEKMATFSVRLDATGVGSIRLRNPRRPLYLDASGTKQTSAADTNPYACADLAFTNTIVTRQFVVIFSGIDPSARFDLMKVRGGTTRCPGTSCSVTFRVGPGAPVRIPLAALYKGYVKAKNSAGAPIPAQAEVVTFGVQFFDDDREPAFPRGYFSLVQLQQLVERKTETAWSSAANAEIAAIPDLSDFDAKFAPAGTTARSVPPPAVGALDSRAQGSVRVSLKQNLGNRASGDFEVRLKSGEYGGTDPSVAATRFRVEVYSFRGTTFSAGRALVAAPSESIALSESGDSVGVRVWRLQVNHLFRKQVRNRTPLALDADSLRTDRDHYTIVSQLTGLPLFGAMIWDAYATFGRRAQARYALDPSLEPPSDKSNIPPPTHTARRYGTVGGELSWPLVQTARVTAAYYKSWATTTLAPDSVAGFTDQGRGSALLMTASYTNFDGNGGATNKRAADWTFQGRYAVGSAEENDPARPNRQEAYLGETAAFAPDVIFLSTIASAAHAKDAIRPRLGQAGALTPGLGNKRYFGAIVNIPRVDAVAALFRRMGLPADSFGDATANLKVHWHQLRNEVPGGSHLGLEVNSAITTDVPKGVKTTLTGAVFFPGGALRSVTPASSTFLPAVRKPVWSLVGTVSVTIP